MAWLKLAHKWLSLLVGLQLLIWLSSGLYFNLMDHQKSSGNQYRERNITQAKVNNQLLLEMQEVLANNNSSVVIKQISLLAKPYYLLTHEQGLYQHFNNRYSLVDAYSGERFVITKKMASAIAKKSYKGPGSIYSVVKLSPPFDDIPREKNEVWQVNFTDALNTSVYVETGSGRLIGHSNDDKRFADFFFMLHFMDYPFLQNNGESGFNNSQIIVFAIFMLFLSLTGFIWTIELLANGQYRLSFFHKKSGEYEVFSIFDEQENQLAALTLNPEESLLESLASQDITLPSDCGGGGSCGSCRIITDVQVKATSAEQQKFSKKQLEKGWRLACQHTSENITQIKLFNSQKIQQNSPFFQDEE